LRSVAAFPVGGRSFRHAAVLTAILIAPQLVSSRARAELGVDAPPVRSAPVATLLHDDRAIAEWLKQRHHDVLAAEARIAQAHADVGTAHLLLPNPQLDIGIGGLSFAPSAPFGTSGNFGVGLTQTIELGKRGVRIEAAELRADESGKTFLDTLGDRVSDARTALAKVAYLKTKWALLEQNLAGAKRVAEVEKSRTDLGQLSGNDYDRLLLDNISLEADIARSRADLDSALAACGQIMLAPCEVGSANLADVDAAAPVPANFAGMGGEIDKRPDVLAARLESAAAERDAVLAGRRAIPDPTVRLGYLRDNTQLNPMTGMVIQGTSANSFQLTLTVPLPIFDHGQHDAAKARFHALEQRHVADGLITGARSDFAGLLHRKAFLQSAMGTLDTVAVPKSAAILDATTKALDLGKVYMTDLILARRTHLALVQTQMDMHFELFGVRNDLRHTLGLDTAGMSAPAASASSSSGPPSDGLPPTPAPPGNQPERAATPGRNVGTR
jgi:cobalt-zinc-cadmium efflux system outer membrane protein